MLLYFLCYNDTSSKRMYSTRERVKTKKGKNMRITRPLLRVLPYMATRVIKRTSVGVSLAVVLVFGTLVSQNMLAIPNKVHAETPPESCFATSGTTTKMITSYYDNEGNNPANPPCPRAVDIPETIGGAPVIGIGTYGMSSRGITAVSFPSSFTTFNQYALAYNQIETVTIPPTVTVINTGVFRANKLTSVVIHDGVTSIGDRAFVDNNLTDIDLPPNLTYLGPRSLWGNQFTELTIPATVTNIGSEAFSYNYSLSSVTIEGDPTTIGSNVLVGTQVRRVVYSGTVYEPQTTNVELAGSCVRFATATQSITSYNSYYNLLDVKNGINCLSSDITIPDNINGLPVLGISYSAFYNKGLTAVVLPSGLTSIESGAFRYNSIQKMTIPATVQSIGDYAYSQNKLNELNILGDDTTIGRWAFSNNELTSVTLPANLETLNEGAFRANYISDIELPVNLKTIGSAAFATNSIRQAEIPSSVTSIASSAFFGQNDQGADIENYENSVNWWSDDPGLSLDAYSSIWYARLILEDSTNQNGLYSSYVTEEEYLYTDVNGDGDMNDSIGGHILQATPFIVRYIDGSGNDLRPTETTTGIIDDTSGTISDYLVKNGPSLPGYVDIWNPTEEELKTVSDVFDATYYQLGDEISWTAPDIVGYVKTSPVSGVFVLGESTSNVLNLGYITLADYEAQNSTTNSPDGLSDTGISVWFIVMTAVGAVAGGSVFVGMSRKRKSMDFS